MPQNQPTQHNKRATPKRLIDNNVDRDKSVTVTDKRPNFARSERTSEVT
jgi:hypothetical protein